MKSENNQADKWYLKPIVVLLLLFLVLGPIGLPLLFKSPHFSKTAKIIVTILICLYSFYLVYAILEIVREALGRIEEIQELSR